MGSKLQKVGIITQARMGSTRLPGKVLLPIGHRSALQVHVDRLKRIGVPIYVATTSKPEDDVIANFAKTSSVFLFRGDEDDVLSRYFKCAREFNLDVIIRVTSDCPLIDNDIIKTALEEYMALGDESLYYSNTIERTFPRGFDFEIFPFQVLTEAYLNAMLTEEREHVTPYIWNNKSGNVTIKQFKQNEDYSDFRLTLDTEADFKLLKLLIEQFKAEGLSGEDITALLRVNPHLVGINNHIQQKNVDC